jgi:hypothetical protein
VRLSELGLDTNIYNRSDNDNPISDFTSKLSPSVNVSLRSSHVRISGRSQFDLYYFKTLPELRATSSPPAHWPTSGRWQRLPLFLHVRARKP